MIEKELSTNDLRYGLRRARRRTVVTVACFVVMLIANAFFAFHPTSIPYWVSIAAIVISALIIPVVIAHYRWLTGSWRKELATRRN